MWMNWALGVLPGLSWLLPACKHLWRTMEWHYSEQMSPKRSKICSRGRDEKKNFFFLIGISLWGDVWRWISGARKRWYLGILGCPQLGLFFFVTSIFCVLVLFCERRRHRARDGKWFSASCWFHLLLWQPISSARRILLQRHPVLDCFDFKGKYLRLCQYSYSSWDCESVAH